MPDSARERYRRAAHSHHLAQHTGHAPLFATSPAVELEPFPDGGGFPRGFLAFAHRTLDCPTPAAVLHICSGSVRGPWTADRRLSVRPAVVADARALPFRDESFDWAIADPPYSRSWAKALYGVTARQYPTPGGIVREALRVLRPGGRLGLLHHLVPPYGGPGVRLVGVWGVYIGPGSGLRAWTVLEKLAPQLQLGQRPEASGPLAVAVAQPEPPDVACTATQAAEAGFGRSGATQTLPSPAASATTGVVAPDERDGPGPDLAAPDERVCAACGIPLARAGRGRRSRFCRPACREAARLRRERGLPESSPRARPGGRRRLGAGDGPTERVTT